MIPNPDPASAVPATVEAFLTDLHGQLAPMPISERAEILLEIRGHLLESMGPAPDAAGIARALAAFGTVSEVAARYREGRGFGRAAVAPAATTALPPTDAEVVAHSRKGNRLLKGALLAALLGTVAVVALGLFVVTRFLPIVKVDENENHVQILGGMIDIRATPAPSGAPRSPGKGEVRIGGLSMDLDEIRILGPGSGDGSHRSSGRASAPGAIAVEFSTGEITLSTATGKDFAWDCELGKKEGEPETARDGDRLKWDVSGFGGVRCQLEIPRGTRLEVDGANGRVQVRQPEFALALELANGDVTLAPRGGSDYRYDLRAVNGRIESFTSSDRPKAWPIRVELVNGRISRGD